jgi:Ca2+-binding RTX toxin-like protein
MALLTFTSSMPAGLRLQALFAPVIEASISFKDQDGKASARFQEIVFQSPVDVMYEGAAISNSHGEVSFLQIGSSSSPWLTYGEAGGPSLFAYDDLVSFHQRGASAAAVIMAGADVLIGSSHGDYMEGYAGDDLLDGGEGADTLDGGSGNDTYMVDNKEDRIYELGGGGYDIVRTSVDFALAPGSEVEVLKAASDSLSLSLFGNEFNNQIVGTAGDDLLDGGAGVDTLTGGAGNDIYLVDNAQDWVLEDAGDGYDTVITRSSYQLGDNIEALKAAAGTSLLTLTGNALSNEIVGNAGIDIIQGLDGNDRLYGDGGNDTISGGDGDDLIYGGIGNDRLDGNAGAEKIFGDIGDDILFGGTGSDSLYGGVGNDRLYGDDDNDWLYGDVGNDVLSGGNGDDRLYGGTGNNTLSGQSGNDLLYGGIHADSLSGGDGNDQLYGDSGNDKLDGGLGRDTLSGGWGRDIFIFRSALNAKSNISTITDFNVRDDTIYLENAIFRKLAKTGALNPAYFTIGSRAHDSNDYVIYNKSTGLLYYDPDGSRHASAILFAKLKPGLALTSSDFVVI